MWLTSKRPARVRTASCSARMPEYSSGMSQPPKFTILAPSRRWMEFRAVLRSSAVAGVVTEDFSSLRRNIEASMRVFECQGTQPAITLDPSHFGLLHFEFARQHGSLACSNTTGSGRILVL